MSPGRGRTSSVQVADGAGVVAPAVLAPAELPEVGGAGRVRRVERRRRRRASIARLESPRRRRGRRRAMRSAVTDQLAVDARAARPAPGGRWACAAQQLRARPSGRLARPRGRWRRRAAAWARAHSSSDAARASRCRAPSRRGASSASAPRWARVSTSAASSAQARSRSRAGGGVEGRERAVGEPRARSERGAPLQLLGRQEPRPGRGCRRAARKISTTCELGRLRRRRRRAGGAPPRLHLAVGRARCRSPRPGPRAGPRRRRPIASRRPRSTSSRARRESPRSQASSAALTSAARAQRRGRVVAEELGERGLRHQHVAAGARRCRRGVEPPVLERAARVGGGEEPLLGGGHVLAGVGVEAGDQPREGGLRRLARGRAARAARGRRRSPARAAPRRPAA